MRKLTPSTRAGVAAVAIAASLVLVGGTGAVAARLITSRDIKDGTINTRDLRDDSITSDKIAPGAVSWEKSFSDATRAQIESLLGEPVPGPQGSPGPAGPAGAAGPAGVPGAPGAAGMGKVVFWDYFGLDGWVDPSEPELTPLHGHSLVLDSPGDYLVTVRGLVGLTPGAPSPSASPSPSSTPSLSPDDVNPFAIVIGQAPGLETFLNACLPSTVLDLGNPLGRCESTFPISVQRGDTVALPVVFTPITGGTTCLDEAEPCGVLAVAAVTVYQVNETPTSDPAGSPGPCGRHGAIDRALRGTAVASRC